MERAKRLKIIQLSASLFFLLLFISCSTTKLVPQGESRLKRNKIEIINNKNYPKSNIEPYIRQQPNNYFIFGWNAFLNIYNWGNDKDTKWDRFTKKLGQAPVIFDTLLVERSKENILSHLEYSGYFNSEVSDSIVTKNKKTTVYYKISMGKQYPIDEIEYNIKDSAIADIFFANQENSKINPGNMLSEKDLNDESERFVSIMRNKGYYNLSKSNFSFRADTSSVKNSANLKMTISPDKLDLYRVGKVVIYPISDLLKYRVSLVEQGIIELDTIGMDDNISIVYDDYLLIKPKVLADINKIKPGDLFSDNVVNTTYDRFSNLRLFNSVNIDLQEGEEHTVDYIIRLSPAKLQGFKFNLEASSNSAGLLGLSPAINYYHRNIFRGGEVFNLGFMGNFQFKINDRERRSTEFGISGSLTIPKFLFLPNSIFKRNLPHTDIMLSYNFQEREEFRRNMVSTIFGYNWNIRRNVFFNIYPIQINFVKLSDMNPGFYESLQDPFLQDAYRDHLDMGSGGTIYYTTDASINPKHSYFYSRFQFDIAGNLLSLFKNQMPLNENGIHTLLGSPFSQYIRGELSIGRTHYFGREENFALAGRFLIGAGNAYGNSTILPFEKLFYSGGVNSLRGWQARTVGPGSSPVDSTFAIPNQLGDMKLEANIELRFKMSKIFRGAVFMDAGNVWNLSKHKKDEVRSDDEGLDIFRFNNFYKSIALNWGLGLRLDLDFVVLRLDMGIKLYDPLDQKWRAPSRWLKQNGFAVHFGIGYPF